ncbi:MAG: HAMP domain-containing sensor histidine kinase [Thermomicrobiales bacterium]
MFRPLRLRLTLLYLLAALLLVAATGGSAYALLRSYFASTTDLALRYRMAQEFRQLGAALPPDLAAAEAAWRGQAIPHPTAKRGDDDHEGDDHTEDSYDPELLAVFVLALSGDGAVLPGGTAAPADAPDAQATAAALARGSDRRTARLGGEPVRLLTYRLPAGTSPALLQLGRPLGDQERVLRQVLLGLLALGGAGALLLGAGSWWLAGRSLAPLQSSWAQQREFVANAGHELRAPLTLFRASAEVALRDVPVDQAEQRELLGELLRESDHMARLVDDLLLLSRLDAGHLPLEREAIPLAPLLAETARQVARLAEERGIRIEARGDGVVYADRRRLRQTLLILLDNALRHTPRGGQITLVGRPAGRRAEIVVTDTGAGIAPEHLPHLFDRFYRAEHDRGDDTGGSGLGLAIAKGLVTAQRGEIRLESQLGQGTRATVTLPAAQARGGADG